MHGVDLRDAYEDTKKTKRIEGLEKLGENLRTALLTPLGSRPNLPTFGSKLHYLQFELISEVFLDLVTLYIQECVTASVPQVSIVGLEHQVNRQHRRVRTNIKFKDVTSGRIGEESITYAGGVFTG